MLLVDSTDNKYNIPDSMEIHIQQIKRSRGVDLASGLPICGLDHIIKIVFNKHFINLKITDLYNTHSKSSDLHIYLMHRVIMCG